MSRKIENRSSNNRIETPLLFVMGDGESERSYFDRLNQMVKTVRIRPYDLGESGWKNIIKKCDGRVKAGEVDIKHGDRLAIITDEDGRYDASSLSAFQKECDRKGYDLFLSNVSFEVWLLMHYERPVSVRSQDDLEERLSHLLGRKYRKSQGIPFDIDMLKRAIENAGISLSERDNLKCLGKNPSTTVHFLVGPILEIEDSVDPNQRSSQMKNTIVL